ncbi:hypothetical protein BGZ74_003113 [Mortierella antarctica]|nr:hypothetical protein BGZ74_003113 [Mortierella antarctica]
MSTPETQFSQQGRPRVLISGAGLSGLTLALLLKNAGNDFLLLDCSHDFNPLGANVMLGPGTARLWQQLGIYDEILKAGIRVTDMSFFTDDLSLVCTADLAWLEDVFKNRENSITRSNLYEILRRQLPEENIHLGKNIIDFEQDEASVTIRCSDNTTYRGDILVGADGAYSTIRQNLYKTLRENGTLPVSDDASLPYSCVCLTGQTDDLDPSVFPVGFDICQNHCVLGVENMFTWYTVSTKTNSICWTVVKYLDGKTMPDDLPDGAAWGQQSTEDICNEVQSYKAPGGKDGNVLTLGDYFDKTPKGSISKVKMHEKVFETWHDGRVVLLGDGVVSAANCGHRNT